MILGNLYSRNGQLEKGLEVDKKLIEIQPREPLYYYNLACTHSLLGHIDPAFQALSRAVQLGYDKVEHLIEDPDLANLKSDGRYDALLRKLQGGKWGQSPRTCKDSLHFIGDCPQGFRAVTISA